MLRQGRPRPAAGARQRTPSRPTAARARSPRSATRTWRRTSAWAARACGSWPPGSATSTPRRSTRTPPTCCRSSATCTLLALVGIVDPPRAEAKAAIAIAHAAGIQVRMITGDHAVTAEAIARQLGITGPRHHRRRVRGDERASRSSSEIDDIGVIARVAPEDKVHLVEILKRKGHVVAMTGDGVNDAPALKSADIGVAMGITGTEVSKEAAVMILTDDNFATIVKAVELGRALYDNLIRYIRFQMARPVRLHRHVPGREPPLHRRGHPVPAAPDPVGQLHGAGVPRHRPRLRQGARGPDGRRAARPEAPDPAHAAHGLARLRRPRDGRGHPRDHLVGDARLRRGGGPDDGPDRVLADEHLVRARDVQRGPARSSRTALENPTLLKAARRGPAWPRCSRPSSGSSTGSSTRST